MSVFSIDDCIFDKKEGRLTVTFPFIVDLQRIKAFTRHGGDHRWYHTPNEMAMVCCGEQIHYWNDDGSLVTPSSWWKYHDVMRVEGLTYEHNGRLRLDDTDDPTGVALGDSGVVRLVNGFLRWAEEVAYVYGMEHILRKENGVRLIPYFPKGYVVGDAA